MWVGDWIRDPGDEAVLNAAVSDGRLLVTLDKDFGEIAIVHGRQHAGIIRLVGFSARRHGRTCRMVLERYASDLSSGAIVTVEPGRVRVRAPEPRD